VRIDHARHDGLRASLPGTSGCTAGTAGCSGLTGGELRGELRTASSAGSSHGVALLGVHRTIGLVTSTIDPVQSPPPRRQRPPRLHGPPSGSTPRAQG
jgi:hypothetical protein